MKLAVFFLPIGLLSACSPFSSREVHDAVYVSSQVPAAPDYELEANWAALPNRKDEADHAPKKSRFPDQQSQAAADVFFIYPTLFTDDPKDRFPWNASVSDKELNKKIDENSIKLQASVFNAAGRIYAPRYRQAHISAYYTNDEAKANAAFDTAYMDIQRAFELFLQKHNSGRPIIIAGHSQGATHGKRLVRDYFDLTGPMLAGERLRGKLVAAYLIGMPIEQDYFGGVPVCRDSLQTGCFVSWRTWQRPATPYKNNVSPAKPALVVNPLSWKIDTNHVSRCDNPGGTLLKLNLKENLVDAQVHQGILWINRPHFFGKRIIKMDNWHVADIGLFYESIRRNAVERVEMLTKAAIPK